MSVNQLRPETAAGESSLSGKYGVATGILAAAVVIGLLVFASSKGSEALRAAQLQRATEIANENRMVCGNWGMRETAPGYAACSKDLDDIRARHELRIKADMEPFGGG